MDIEHDIITLSELYNEWVFMERARDNQWKFLEPAIEDLVRRDHPYRKMLELVDFRGLLNPVAGLYHKKWGRPGYGVERGFKALMLQWMEDLSDRELERFLQENTSAKMFCDFSLTEKTPGNPPIFNGRWK